MDTVKYYVFRVLHNGETGGEDYQKPDVYTDLEQAKKKFHEYLSTYIAYGKLTVVSVIITDSYGNMVARECWTKPVEVTPEVEPEVEA